MRLPTKVSTPGKGRSEPDEVSPIGTVTEFLGWIKCQGQWRLCWGELFEPYNNWPTEEWKPIAECPMEKRVEMAEHLGALRKAMNEAKVSYLPKVEKAIALLKQALAK